MTGGEESSLSQSQLADMMLAAARQAQPIKQHELGSSAGLQPQPIRTCRHDPCRSLTFCADHNVQMGFSSSLEASANEKA